MTITPGELLETSIAQLQTLVAFLDEQLDGSVGGDPAQSNALEVRACKDMLVSLTLLLQGESHGEPSSGAATSTAKFPRFALRSSSAIAGTGFLKRDQRFHDPSS